MVAPASLVVVWVGAGVQEATIREAIDRALSRSHARSRASGRPFVTLSYAQALDGSIAGPERQPLRLSGAAALCLTHELRAKHDAILVGIGTALADDPLLTTRLVRGASPQPVVVDSRLRLPLSARLLQNGDRRLWLAACSPVVPARRDQVQAQGAEVLEIEPTPDGRVDLAALLAELARRGIERLMVEGGARIIASFLALHLIDQVVITVTPRLVGGLAIASQPGQVLPALANVAYGRFGDDIVACGELTWEG
jgi:3,4-dihydroxy 2-butanone 4-phosphate synthase/GTP cyclohydrolase II